MRVVRAPLAAALCAVAFSSGCGGKLTAAGSPQGDEHPLLGAPAPEFDLPAIQGGDRVSLADMSGKVGVIDFWATWCEPCKESFPFYQKLSREHGDAVRIVGISVDDEPDGIKAFAEETGARFPLAWDERQEVAQRYNPPSMPTSFIVDRSGIVRFVHTKFKSGDTDSIEAQVAGLLK